MRYAEEQKLLVILKQLTDATTTVNDNVQNLMEVVKMLHERVTRLENAK